MKEIQIEDKVIGNGHKPFIIAEMSGNHNGSKERALKLVEVAAQAGVDALKLQTYTADTMTLDLAGNEFYINDPQNPWKGQSLHQLYEKAHTPWEWHQEIFALARKRGLLPFSSPFDGTAVDFLESIHNPLYKIASFELTDIPLIKRVAQTGKPLIMSIGMASVAEIQEAVDTARNCGCDKIVLLKCTSTYPASPRESNLATLPHLKSMTDCLVGVSDHTRGIGAAVASIALGAQVIEKHFTLDRSEGGPDAEFSLEPQELQRLVDETTAAWQSLGKIQYGCTDGEKNMLQYRRSIYSCRDIEINETLSTKNIKIIRPGLGLAPKHLEQILGCKAKEKIPKGTPISWKIIE